MKTLCVYMLASKRNGTLYIGVTSNHLQRVWQNHNDLVESFASPAVIPAWMPESSHRDVKLYLAPRLNNTLTASTSYHPWHWIPASMPV